METPAAQMRNAMPAQFRLDVAVAPGNAREFDLLREGLSPLYAMDAPNARARSSFGASMTSYQFADVAVCSGAASAAHFERTSQTIARSGIDNICVQLYSHGGCDLDIEGRAIDIHPGDVCFLDMTRRNTVRAPDYRSLTIVLPRTLIAPFVADVDSLHGQVVPKHAPLNTLLTNHLWTLLSEAPALNVSDVVAASRAIAAMIAAFAGPSVEGRDSIAATATVVSLHIARRIVEANLHNPDFGPDVLCRYLGVSRATLYRLFESIGGVNQYIQQRRMRRAYQLMVDPAHAQDRVSTLAMRCGFSNVSVFNRAFRQAHGMSPTELRIVSASAQRDHSEASGERGFRIMKRWLLGMDATAA